ncbi:cell division protein ZapD [Ferrimonas futtsuensis]|uniref:cell division protein ZapD n=1 Tax=Ferrimonas futtsuensis TaxID=364764 RepID=UPI00040B6D01|nr:cell division protein ZapD [Ferrimonas futtsuensis]
MSNSTLYEHPLNERTRFYLRVEQLIQSLEDSRNGDCPSAHRSLFRTLFELCDLLERSDIKGDLAKQVDQSLTLVNQWQSQPGVDQQQLQALVDTLKGQNAALLQMERPGSSLRQDRFLSQIRQRVNLAGGACGFDLPRLQFWLGQPKEQRIHDIEAWQATLAPLTESIALQLQLIRECSHWENKVAIQGQFLHNADHPLALLRVRLDNHYGCYPVVSGHKNRFSLHMMNASTGSAEVRNLPFSLSLSMETP